MNTSGRPQLLENLGKLGMRKTRTVAVMNQEYQVRSGGIGDLQKAASDEGWKLRAAGAVAGKGASTSAGVAVAIQKHIGSDETGLARGGRGTGVAEGRIVATWVEGGVRGGILCLSAYLWTTEGLSERNVEVLAQLGEMIRQRRGPWIIGGDFNMSPERLRSEAGWWLEKVGGCIKATEQTTFRPQQGTHSELDYFIVDVNIEHAVVRTEVVVSLEVRPHRAVRLVIRPLGANQLVTVMRRPREFPRDRPTGCARRPAVPHRPGEAMWKGDGIDHDGAKELEGTWKGLVACVELELCGLCDNMPKGKPDVRYIGRAEGARLVQEQSLPQRGARARGRLDVNTYGYAWTETRVRELIWLGKRASEKGIHWPAAARAQWHGLIGRFQRPGKLLKAITKEDAQFAECVAFVSGPDVC